MHIYILLRIKYIDNVKKIVFSLAMKFSFGNSQNPEYLSHFYVYFHGQFRKYFHYNNVLSGSI